jgi:hypothetical protein
MAGAPPRGARYDAARSHGVDRLAAGHVGACAMSLCDLADCPLVVEHHDVETLATTLGITLVGEEGKPDHCGQRMRVKVGIAGPDYARCDQCGLTIGNGASPHMNGGIIWSEAFLEAHGDAMWAVLTPANAEAAS